MIQIKPVIEQKCFCPYCNSLLMPREVVWQGIHVCVISACPSCNAEIIEDLRIGHALSHPLQIDLNADKIFIKSPNGHPWFGTPLFESLKNPRSDLKVSLTVDKIEDRRDVVILNCIDYLYGHALLKLLNLEAHLNDNPELGAIVIVPSFLKWMIPKGVTEVWTVDIPLSSAQYYIPELNDKIHRECLRFDRIYISLAHAHPKYFNITNFTGVDKHDFSKDNYRISFIWREDRIWGKLLHLGGISDNFFLKWQNYKVRHLFSLLRRNLPRAVFTIAGMGTTTTFPGWIDDRRVSKFDSENERESCRVYSESRVVIGIHGSNMLLPSGHAGMTVDLMPKDRWANFAQDVLYQEDDNRLSSYKYRYFPADIGINSLVGIISAQLTYYSIFKRLMQYNQPG